MIQTYSKEYVDKLEAVYEAAKWMDVNPDYAEHQKRLKDALAAVSGKREEFDCDHDLFTPEDRPNFFWGEYQLCRVCKSIVAPDGSIFMQGPPANYAPDLQDTHGK